MTYREEDADAVETPLLGGDVTEGLVRRGDTVRRPQSSASAVVRELLVALEHNGFDGAPRYLGVDAHGRDVLSFVEGEVAGRPWPAWVADESRVVSVARLVRRYDDAAGRLGLPAWSLEAGSRDPGFRPLETAGPPELVAHLDITPENVVFRDGIATALIDFDLARPASRVHEVANLLLWWAPWQAEVDRAAAFSEVDPFERGRLLVDAYGLDHASRTMIVPASREIAERSYGSMKRRAETLGGGWQRMWDEGVGDIILRRQVWLAENEAALSASLR